MERHRGTLVANHCILEDANVALIIDSAFVHVSSLQIIRPLKLGVEITRESAEDIDFGSSSIISSLGSGIRIARRDTSIALRNVILKSNAETGIEFEDPSGNITIQNVTIENSGSFSLHLEQNPRYAVNVIHIENTTVSRQERGRGGLFISLSTYRSLFIGSSLFFANTVTSIGIFLKCNRDDVDEGNVMIPSLILIGNRFDSNNNFVLHARIESCINAIIHNNNFIANNEYTKNGAVAIEIAPDERPKEFQVEISENLWAKNKGAWCLYIAASNPNPLNGSVHGNKFEGNENLRGSVIVGSPHFRINNNEFNNRLEKFDLEVEFLQSDPLDATKNYWGQEDSESIVKRILDGRTDRSRGLVRIDPISRKRAAISANDCTALSNCSSNGKCVGHNQCLCDAGFGGEDCSRVSCASLNNCSTNGYCIAPNLCQCNDGWFEDDCSKPSCDRVANCSGHGQCVSLNECLCDSLYQGVNCSEPTTNCSITGCNNHGSCVSGECICESGWTVPFCSRAVCDRLNNCSNAGTCVRPNVCECSPGYTGDDCSLCEGSMCSHCEFRCVHGSCDPNSRVCICRGDWTGAACDICARDKCDSLSVALFVLPPAIGVHHDDGTVVTVYGNDFPTSISLFTLNVMHRNVLDHALVQHASAQPIVLEYFANRLNEPRFIVTIFFLRCLLRQKLIIQQTIVLLFFLSFSNSFALIIG
ncbi:unnamed protein product [Toxocara canis]|uniref:EGF-like domain-containing protein n=1 Tax=Toxocara canis TaxID=6265 RepID=A0A183VCQ5_TOXCA|nr:unnamed protein product [Toxocara canis]